MVTGIICSRSKEGLLPRLGWSRCHRVKVALASLGILALQVLNSEVSAMPSDNGIFVYNTVYR